MNQSQPVRIERQSTNIVTDSCGSRATFSHLLKGPIEVIGQIHPLRQSLSLMLLAGLVEDVVMVRSINEAKSARLNILGKSNGVRRRNPSPARREFTLWLKMGL